MNKQKKKTGTEKSKLSKPEQRPRDREFAKVSTGLIYKTLKILDPDPELGTPDIIHALKRDLGDWVADKISDKLFCGRLFNHWHNLTILFNLLSREKEVAEFMEDQTAYEEEYARKNPEPEDQDDDVPF